MKPLTPREVYERRYSLLRKERLINYRMSYGSENSPEYGLMLDALQQLHKDESELHAAAYHAGCTDAYSAVLDAMYTKMEMLYWSESSDSLNERISNRRPLHFWVEMNSKRLFKSIMSAGETS